jgi:5-methyltetrahydrofolate--homocysteine methyltransferase
LGDEAYEISVAAARLARQAADEFTTPEKPRFVAGAMGPTTKAITVTGGITFDGLREAYYDQAKGLLDGGADLLLIETSQDTRNIKAALLAIQRLAAEIGVEIPVHGFRHHRTHGHDAGRADRRGAWASLRHATCWRWASIAPPGRSS